MRTAVWVSSSITPCYILPPTPVAIWCASLGCARSRPRSPPMPRAGRSLPRRRPRPNHCQITFLFPRRRSSSSSEKVYVPIPGGHREGLQVAVRDDGDGGGVQVCVDLFYPGTGLWKWHCNCAGICAEVYEDHGVLLGGGGSGGSVALIGDDVGSLERLLVQEEGFAAAECRG